MAILDALTARLPTLASPCPYAWINDSCCSLLRIIPPHSFPPLLGHSPTAATPASGIALGSVGRPAWLALPCHAAVIQRKAEAHLLSN